MGKIALLLFILGLSFSACTNSGPAIQKKDRPNRALLIIDLQRGVLEADAPASIGTTRAQTLVQNAQLVIRSAQHNNMPMAYVKNEIPSWRFFENWWFHNAFKKDGAWANIDPRLTTVGSQPSPLIFSKQMPSAFSNEGLNEWLAQNKVGTLWIIGLFGDQCVTSTTLEALSQGYAVTLLGDAIVTKDPNDLAVALEKLRVKGAKIKTALTSDTIASGQQD